ncbi:MAG: TolC family protein [Planctomycetota bacterium]
MDAVKRSTAILFATSLLVSCTAYHERPLDPAGLAATFHARTLRDAPIVNAFAATKRPLPTDTWTSGDFWLVASCCHPELVASRAEVAAAAAAIAEAEQRENPKLSLLPLRVLNADPGVSPWITGGSLEFPLDLFGKRSATVAIAVAEHVRAGALAAGKHWQLFRGVHVACCRCWYAVSDAAVTEADSRARRRLVDLLTTRVRNGYAAPADFTLAQTEFARAGIEAAAAAAEAEQARAALATAIGLPKTALAGVAIAEPSVPMNNLPDLLYRGVLGRGDLQAAIADYAIADARLRLAIAAQYPDLILGPGYDVDQGSRRVQLGLSLTLPLWHDNGAGIERAEADRTAAAHRFDAVQTAAFQSVDAAKSAVAAAQRTSAATAAWSSSLEAQAKRATAFVEAGLDDQLAAILAQSVLLSAQRALLRSHRDAALAQIAWETELGPHGPAEAAARGSTNP